MFKAIDHLVLTSAMPERLISFYAKLGFKVMRSAARTELHAGSFKVNLHHLGAELQPHAKLPQPGAGDFCIELDVSLDEFCAVLNREQITIELGPVVRTGARGNMMSVYLRDTDGNLVEFCSYSV